MHGVWAMRTSASRRHDRGVRDNWTLRVSRMAWFAPCRVLRGHRGTARPDTIASKIGVGFSRWRSRADPRPDRREQRSAAPFPLQRSPSADALKGRRMQQGPPPSLSLPVRLPDDQVFREPVGVGEEELLARRQTVDRTDIDALRAERAAGDVHPDLTFLGIFRLVEFDDAGRADALAEAAADAGVPIVDDLPAEVFRDRDRRVDRRPSSERR